MFIMPEFLFPLYSVLYFYYALQSYPFFSERGNFLLKRLLM